MKVIKKKITNPDELFAPMDTSGLPLGGRLSEFTETNIEARNAKQHYEQAAQAQDPKEAAIHAFFAEAQDYARCDENKEPLLAYLTARKLSITKTNLLRAWAAMKRAGVAILKGRAAEASDAQSVTPAEVAAELENASTEDINRAYAAIREARIRRKIRIDSAGPAYRRQPL